MQCRVCNATEFVVFDGVYFCKECSSQIEASRKEEAEQEGGFSRKSLISKSAKEKTQEEKHEKLFGDWITIEGYNIILQKQVATLISLGASEKLKNVVLYMWSKYLEKCEIAFRTGYRSKENIPRLNAMPTRRDMKVLYGDKVARRIEHKRKKKKSKSKKKVESEDIQIKEEVVSDDYETTECVTTDADPDSASASESEDSSTNKKNKPKFSASARKCIQKYGKIALKKIGGLPRLVHTMSLCKTLSFCYLGLLYTEDRLLLCDLLRLVKERKVPYIDVTDIFPPSMQMIAWDQCHFSTYSVPSVHDITLTAAKLVEFLKLPSFKHPPPMPAVFRFVKELNLPDSIIAIANHLYSKMERKNELVYQALYNKSGHVCRIPKYDVQAMALVVVSLKLMLVLDGKFEIEHSNIMRKINVLLEGKKMFVWDEWQKQMKLKEFIFLKSGLRYSDLSRLDILSIDEIIRKYPISRIKEYGEYTNRSLIVDYKFTAARKELKALIENITQQEDTEPSTKTTSFPLKQELTWFTNESDTWEMFKETTQRDLTFLNKDFSSDFMFYRRTDEISEKSEELIYLLLSTLYVSSEVVILDEDFNRSKFDKMLKTSSNYWYLNIQSPEFDDHRQQWREKLPDSFIWLLEVLCKYLQVSCRDLYLEVVAIEKEIFLHTDRFERS